MFRNGFQVIRLVELVLILLLVAVSSARAQFGGGWFASNGQIVIPPPPPVPTGITFTSATVVDTTTSGATIGTLSSSNVTMSTGNVFSGTCSVTDSNTTGPGPGGSYVKMVGCALEAAANYGSANDGTHGSITLTACQNGTCVNQAFTLTINAASGLTPPAAATAGCSASGNQIPANSGSLSNGSCFNTLAMNIDFTGATQSSINGISFNVSPLSNWLDCAGASSPIFYLLGHLGPTPPCSDVSLVTDGSTQVLLVKYTLADASAGNGGTIVQNTNGAASAGYTFPTEYYVEWRLREGASSDTATCSGNPCHLANVWDFQARNGGLYFEDDFIEMYSNGSDAGGSAIGGLCNGSGPQFCLFGNKSLSPSSPSGYSHEVYNTMGWRRTNDGNKDTMTCFYLNGTQGFGLYPSNGNCDHETVNSSVDCSPQSATTCLSLPVGMILQAAGPFIGTVPTAEIDTYFQYLRVWTCANWNKPDATSGRNGGTCAGALQYSNP